MLHPVQSAGPWPMSETHPGGDRSPGQVQGKVNAAELPERAPIYKEPPYTGFKQPSHPWGCRIQSGMTSRVIGDSRPQDAGGGDRTLGNPLH